MTKDEMRSVLSAAEVAAGMLGIPTTRGEGDSTVAERVVRSPPFNSSLTSAAIDERGEFKRVTLSAPATMRHNRLYAFCSVMHAYKWLTLVGYAWCRPPNSWRAEYGVSFFAPGCLLVPARTLEAASEYRLPENAFDQHKVLRAYAKRTPVHSYHGNNANNLFDVVTAAIKFMERHHMTGGQPALSADFEWVSEHSDASTILGAFVASATHPDERSGNARALPKLQPQFIENVNAWSGVFESPSDCARFARARVAMFREGAAFNEAYAELEQLASRAPWECLSEKTGEV